MRIRLGWTAVGLCSAWRFPCPASHLPSFPSPPSTAARAAIRRNRLASGSTTRRKLHRGLAEPVGSLLPELRRERRGRRRRTSSVATTGFQSRPRVARNASGASVGALRRARRAAAAPTPSPAASTRAAPIGALFHVNTYTTGYQQAPSRRDRTVGSVRRRLGELSESGRVRLAASSASGSTPRARPWASEFPINSYTTERPAQSERRHGRFGPLRGRLAEPPPGRQRLRHHRKAVRRGRVAAGRRFRRRTRSRSPISTSRASRADDAGDFVVVWETEATDGSGYGIVRPALRQLRNAHDGRVPRQHLHVQRPGKPGRRDGFRPEISSSPGRADAEDDPAGRGFGHLREAIRPEGAAGRRRVPRQYVHDRRPDVPVGRSRRPRPFRHHVAEQSARTARATESSRARGGFPPPAALKVDAHGGGGTVSNANGGPRAGRARSGSSPRGETPVRPRCRLDRRRVRASPGRAARSTRFRTRPPTTGSIAAGATQGLRLRRRAPAFRRASRFPPSRPATHWDATFLETLVDGRRQRRGPFTSARASPTCRSRIPTTRRSRRCFHTGITTGCDTDALLPFAGRSPVADGDLPRQGDRGRSRGASPAGPRRR